MRRPLAAALCLLCVSALADKDVSLGMDTDRLERIDAQVRRAIDAGECAGCVVAVGRRAGVVWTRSWGERQTDPQRQPMRPDTVFDLASLTKPVATATSVMVLLERGELRLADTLGGLVPEVTGEHGDDVTVAQLLTHHAGYVPDNPLVDFQDGPAKAWERLFALEPRDPPGTRFVYSDVGFELLGAIVERVSGRSLDRFVTDEVFAPLGMTETTFLPRADLASRAAATEPRDGRMLIGEVHDPRAALLGGVAGHAGLFSTAADLARYARMMLGEGELEGVRVLGPATVQEMTRARDVSGARRALGWDARSGYSSNRGELMSDRAFGHGGFTGTAMWIDPGLDLFVVFLANRLHPDGEGSVNPLAGRVGTIAAASLEEIPGQ